MEEATDLKRSQAEILDQTRHMIREKMSGEGTGHDWWHIDRVTQVALKLGREEGVDLFVVELGALLHDIADHKFHDGDETVGPRKCREWLTSLSTEPEVIEKVVAIVEEISYKGAGVPTHMSSPEGEVVQDADRLDAIGAIGIARTFAYGGHKGQPIYDPELKPTLHQDKKDYMHGNGTTINHFYEKLLLLKDRMNTESGKRWADQRHQLMEDFLKRFYQEWESRDLAVSSDQ